MPKGEFRIQKDPFVLSPETEAAVGSAVLGVLRNDPRFKDQILIATNQDCRASTQEETNRLRLQLQQNSLLAGLPGAYEQNQMATIICHQMNVRGKESGDGTLVRWPHNNDASTGRENYFLMLHGDITDPNSTPASNFAKFAGIASKDIKTENIPGSIQDWRAFLLYHEAGHYLHGPVEHDSDKGASVTGRREFHAESEGYNLYRTAYQQGIVKDPEVPIAYSISRSLSTMLRGNTSLMKHDLAVFAPTTAVGADTHIDLHNYEEASAGGGNAIKRVYAEIGRAHLTEADHVMAKLQSIQSLVDQNKIPPVGDLKPDAQGFVPTLHSLTPEQQKKIIETTAIPDHLKGQFESTYQKSLEGSAYGKGLSYLAEREAEAPALLYATTRKLYQEGAFSGNKWEQEFSKMFLLAAERYAGDHFKTNGQTTVDIAPYLKVMESAPERQQTRSVSANPAAASPQL